MTGGKNDDSSSAQATALIIFQLFVFKYFKCFCTHPQFYCSLRTPPKHPALKSLNTQIVWVNSSTAVEGSSYACGKVPDTTKKSSTCLSMCLSAWVNSNTGGWCQWELTIVVKEGSIPQYFTEQNNLSLYLNSFVQKWTMATNNCKERAAIYGKWLILEETGSIGVISLWVNT